MLKKILEFVLPLLPNDQARCRFSKIIHQLELNLEILVNLPEFALWLLTNAMFFRPNRCMRVEGDDVLFDSLYTYVLAGRTSRVDQTSLRYACQRTVSLFFDWAMRLVYYAIGYPMRLVGFSVVSPSRFEHRLRYLWPTQDWFISPTAVRISIRGAQRRRSRTIVAQAGSDQMRRARRGTPLRCQDKQPKTRWVPCPSSADRDETKNLPLLIERLCRQAVAGLASFIVFSLGIAIYVVLVSFALKMSHSHNYLAPSIEMHGIASHRASIAILGILVGAFGVFVCMVSEWEHLRSGLNADVNAPRLPVTPALAAQVMRASYGFMVVASLITQILSGVPAVLVTMMLLIAAALIATAMGLYGFVVAVPTVKTTREPWGIQCLVEFFGETETLTFLRNFDEVPVGEGYPRPPESAVDWIHSIWKDDVQPPPAKIRGRSSP